MEEIIRQNERFDRSMNNQEALESPLFTTTPAANATPVADGSGDIADGWLSANVPLENTANTFSETQTFDNGAVIKQSVSTGDTLTIPAGYCMVVCGDYTVTGDLSIAGDFAIVG